MRSDYYAEVNDLWVVVIPRPGKVWNRIGPWVKHSCRCSASFRYASLNSEVYPGMGIVSILGAFAELGEALVLRNNYNAF
ncbi:hypothetical protein LCGC14_0232450 [marine sediment metagenome]|uniref:Uncharacterized protein n=1 Tax=marine sediment metagenome TaxID=412755 RepID=A0A0F9UEN1_9ZZZZ